MENKTNEWKVIFFILLLVLSILSTSFYYETRPIDFGDVEVDKKTFDNLMNTFDLEKGILICNIEETECINIRSMKGKDSIN